MNRKHNRTFNPIKAHQARKARAKRIERGYMVADILILVSLVHSVKSIISTVSSIRSARKSTTGEALNVVGEGRITSSLRALQVAKFERRNARGIKARIAAQKNYRAAFKSAVAEADLVNAAQVATGAEVQYREAFGKHIHVRSTSAQRKAERQMKKATKGQDEQHLSAVN